MSLDIGVPPNKIMKTGIEKFKNIVDKETCNLLIQHLENNIDKTEDVSYNSGNNVICKELVLTPKSELDQSVHKILENVLEKYFKKYPSFVATGDTGYQLRKISGATREHVDNICDPKLAPDKLRTVSVILGLNSDYEYGEFHFPFQNYITTVKRGEAIVFPVYFMYPHFVDAPIGNRYTINTWLRNSCL